MNKILTLFLVMTLGYSGFGKILKRPIPDKLVVFTFDDATASQYTIVAPLLKEFGFGATFYVCEFPAKPEEKSVYMNWQQIKELDRMGFEIANHTRNHVAASKVSREKLLEELSYIDKKCDSVGIARPADFAYPGYDLSASVLELLQEKGYLLARAGGSRAYEPLKDSPLLIPSWAMNATNKEQMMEAFKEARDGKIVVLTIHGVPDVKHPWVNTPPELFREYLNYLKENHYKVISMAGLSHYIRVKEALKEIKPDLTRKYKN